MPREAKLFLSSAGSAARGFLRFRANIPPRWIRNAHKSRKGIEPEIVDALRSLRTIQRNRPRARVALTNASKQFKAVLSRWETAYKILCRVVVTTLAAVPAGEMIISSAPRHKDTAAGSVTMEYVNKPNSNMTLSCVWEPGKRRCLTFQKSSKVSNHGALSLLSAGFVRGSGEQSGEQKLPYETDSAQLR
jgi:hypothetical protein